MKNLLLILFAFLFQIDANAQFEKLAEINFTGDYFCTDNLGFVYTVDGETLTKYSQKGEKIQSYSNSKFGKITSIDTNNPLQILVFYKDFNQVVLLDNTLSQISNTISLDELNIESSELVCSASNGGFWVFNGISSQLNYFDQNLKLIHKGIDIRPFTKAENTPIFMLERNNSIYMNMSGNEIYVFDLFGIFKQKISLKVKNSFQVFDAKIYYFDNSNLLSFSPQFQNIDTLKIPENANVINAKIENNLIYELVNGKICIYKQD
jgi:hypothetical protein